MPRTSLGLGLSLPFGYSPLAINIILSLFRNGEQGAYYDVQDLSTMYQDSAGTIAAVINQPIGLHLDKRLYLVRGSEKVANGTFNTDISGWVNTGTNGASTISWVSPGALHIVNDNSGGSVRADYNANLSTDVWYELKFDLIAAPIGSIQVMTAGTTILQPSSVGSYTVIFKAESASIGFLRAFPVDVTIDNVSIKQLYGNHRYQKTTAAKPLLRGTPVGANLAPGNGTFDDATGWGLGANWTISGGKLNATLSTAAASSQGAPPTAGRIYRVRYTISNISAGSVLATLGSATGTSRTENGTYSEYITAVSATKLAFNGGSGGFTGSIDNVDLRDVTADVVSAPYFLHYDGFDDFLTTGNIDFTSTNAITVFSGIRKITDIAIACVCEFSTSSNASSGSFGILAPVSAGVNNVTFQANAGIARGAIAAGFSAPITLVLTGQASISSDTVTTRVNGVQVAQNTNDLGTATTFASGFQMYFGRRGGSSLPFSGYEYDTIIRGAATSTTDVSSVESELNSFIGAY